MTRAQDPCDGTAELLKMKLRHSRESTRRTSTSHITVHTLTHSDHSKYTVCCYVTLTTHMSRHIYARCPSSAQPALCRLRRVAATARSHTTSPVPFIPLACSEAGRPRHAAMRLSPHPIHTAQLSMPAEIAAIDHAAAPPPAACPARPHAARPPPRPSPFTPRASRLAPHASRLAPRASPLAPRASRLAPRTSRLAPHAETSPAASAGCAALAAAGAPCSWPGRSSTRPCLQPGCRLRSASTAPPQ